MVIFNSYVKLPEGINFGGHPPPKPQLHLRKTLLRQLFVALNGCHTGQVARWPVEGPKSGHVLKKLWEILGKHGKTIGKTTIGKTMENTKKHGNFVD
jgi:hypothetical protein